MNAIIKYRVEHFGEQTRFIVLNTFYCEKNENNVPLITNDMKKLMNSFHDMGKSIKEIRYPHPAKIYDILRGPDEVEPNIVASIEYDDHAVRNTIAYSVTAFANLIEMGEHGPTWDLGE